MPDEPTLGEIARLVGDLRQDVREDFAGINARLDQFVLREVYAADRTALDLRLTRMEREAENSRAAVRNAILGSIGAVAASLISGIVLAFVLKG